MRKLLIVLLGISLLGGGVLGVLAIQNFREMRHFQSMSSETNVRGVNVVTNSDNQSVTNVNVAFAYIRQSVYARTLVKDFLVRNGSIIVVPNTHCYDETSVPIGGLVIIHWDAHCAHNINGRISTPAFAFAHEFAHVHHQMSSLLLFDLRKEWNVPGYDNLEEKQTILEDETIMALELGEPTRHSHSVMGIIRVSGPTSRN